MKYTLSAALIASFVLSGCSTMFAHVKYSDDETAKNGRSIALLERCASLNLSNPSTVNEFKVAFAQLLTVSSYNEALLAKSYEDAKFQLAGHTKATLGESCSPFNAQANYAIAGLRQKYTQISGARSAEMAGMAASMSSVQAPSSSMSVTPQVTQPNFAPQSKPTWTYLVNTGSGQKLCTVYAAGVTRCQ